MAEAAKGTTHAGKRPVAGRPGAGNFRWCDHCARPMIDHDACLGEIPGVSHACCGHGVAADAYVVLGGKPNEDATKTRNLTLRGRVAIEFFHLVHLGIIQDPE